MKHIITILVLCAGIHLNAGAQDFTQRIQQTVPGMGSVTIHQSAAIDRLVNSAQLTAKVATPNNPVANNKPAATTKPTAENKATVENKATTTENKATTTENKSNNPAATTTSENPTAEANTLPVDNTKKILRGGYKIPGFRVQAFAGGNSRKDRQQAEKVGSKIKASYPTEPVYVHFYSPRWICRVGNYRTYEEAHQMLISLRKLGFTQATIVKGKITVTN